MSRCTDYTIAFDVPAEDVYGDFTSRPYWQALTDYYRTATPQCEITKFHTDELGTDIVLEQVVPRSYLPQIARKVIPVDMAITRVQHFDPYDHTHKRAQGTYTATVPRAPGRFDGSYELTGTATGSALRLSTVCKVYVPVIGGILEDLILHHIKELFNSEEEFTADWIAQHY